MITNRCAEASSPTAINRSSLRDCTRFEALVQQGAEFGGEEEGAGDAEEVLWLGEGAGEAEGVWRAGSGVERGMAGDVVGRGADLLGDG